MGQFEKSSKGNPCPICERTKDSDCRSKEQQNLILCHTITSDPGGPINGYKFYKPTNDGMWGVFLNDQRTAKGELKGRKIRAGEKRSAFYYPARDGTALLKVEKVKQGDQKQFYQYHWDGHQWVAGVPDSIKPSIPIYRYAEVRAAINEGQPIIIVEGETSADALWDIGLAATTFLGGAKKYRSYGTGYKADLEGASLYLCPDRDVPGLAHMDEVAKDFPDARLIKVFPKSPIWLSVPVQNGLDVEDWIAEGATAADILGAVEDRKSEDKRSIDSYLKLQSAIESLIDIRHFGEREYACQKLAQKAGVKYDFIKAQLKAIQRERYSTGGKGAKPLTALLKEERARTTEVVPRFLAENNITLVASAPGTGKTLLAYEFAYQAATGGEFLDCKFKRPLRILFYQLDESEGDMKSRLQERFEEIMLSDQPDKMNRYEAAASRIAVSRILDFGNLLQIENDLREVKPDVVIVDNFREAIARSGIDENTQMAGEILGEVRDVIRDFGISMLLIHHENKSKFAEGQDKVSGHSSIMQQCGYIFNLKRPKEKSQFTARRRVLECSKNRLGEDGQKYNFELIRTGECSWKFEYQGQEGEDPKDRAVMDDIVLAVHELTYYHLANYPSNYPTENDRVWLSVADIREHRGIPSNANHIYKSLSKAIERAELDEMKRPDSSKGGKLRRFFAIPQTEQLSPPLIEKYTELDNCPQSEAGQGVEQLSNHRSVNYQDNCSPNYPIIQEDNCSIIAQDNCSKDIQDKGSSHLPIPNYLNYPISTTRTNGGNSTEIEKDPRNKTYSKTNSTLKEVNFNGVQFRVGDRVDWLEKNNGLSKCPHFQIERLSQQFALIFPGHKEVPLSEIFHVQYDL